MSNIGTAGSPVSIYNAARAHRGYTLLTPYASKKFFLVDMLGRVVHYWDTQYPAAMHGVLLPNGNLLYLGQLDEGPFNHEFGGAAGALVEMDWDGKEVWRHEDVFFHHDFYRMDNGNNMVLRFDAAPDDVASRFPGGIAGTERKGVVWFASFHEIDPEGNVVWEWYGYDHFDPELDAMCPLDPRCEWDHCNAVKVLPDGNVMTTCFSLNNIYIIDKSSSDIIWRWGAKEGELAHPHDPTLLENGNILVFDNGLHRPMSPPSYSRVLEVNRETGEIEWLFQESNTVDFYGSYISGCQRLSNGNTLICVGPKGHFFEVTPEGEKVWDYVNPFFEDVPIFNIGRTNAVFRAHRYDHDYSGLEGKTLDPQRHSNINTVYAS